jgi:transposase InsO family protein
LPTDPADYANVTVTNELVSNFFLRFSPPEQLHSGQGRQFESALLQEVCRTLCIHKTHYHPQGDGLVERFNRNLLSMLATSAKDNPATWETHLPKLCLAYNTSIQASTGYTPFFLMFGREARLPVDIMFGPSPTDA